jgi:hypothetical protein
VKREENNSGVGFWLALSVIAAALWVALLVSKAAGAVHISWPAALLALFWISAAVMLSGIFVIVGGDKLERLMKQAKKRRRQREMIRTISETMKILTMNGVGGVYGVKREPGESNRHFQKRINAAACELDNSERRRPAPATGAKLDRIAEAHGLTRGAGETDAELQERIRQRVFRKLEGAGK